MNFIDFCEWKYSIKNFNLGLINSSEQMGDISYIQYNLTLYYCFWSEYGIYKIKLHRPHFVHIEQEERVHQPQGDFKFCCHNGGNLVL